MLSLSIETLARIVSQHHANKETREAVTALENDIERLDDALRGMRAALSDIKDTQDTMADLASDLEDEMTTDEKMNFKRLAGLE